MALSVCGKLGLWPGANERRDREKVDQTDCEMHSRQHEPLVARWDHVISTKPCGRSIYRDTIEINAGILTFAVWAWANWVYRNRSADGVHLAKISEESQQRVHCEDALQLL